jgi:hypothetical protein
MTSHDVRLDLTITDTQADAEQLDDLTVRLVRDLFDKNQGSGGNQR